MYFLTTIRLNNEGVGDQRPVGYFKSFKDAASCAIYNKCDIFEDGYYDYAIVVFIEPGLYPNKIEKQWYTFNKETGMGYEVDRVSLLDKFGHKFYPYILG